MQCGLTTREGSSVSPWALALQPATGREPPFWELGHDGTAHQTRSEAWSGASRVTRLLPCPTLSESQGSLHLSFPSHYKAVRTSRRPPGNLVRLYGSIPVMVWGNARLPGSHPLTCHLEPQPAWPLARPGTTGTGGGGQGLCGDHILSQASPARMQAQNAVPPSPSDTLRGRATLALWFTWCPAGANPTTGSYPLLQGKAPKGPSCPRHGLLLPHFSTHE